MRKLQLRLGLRVGLHGRRKDVIVGCRSARACDRAVLVLVAVGGGTPLEVGVVAVERRNE